MADGYFKACKVYDIDYPGLINLSYAELTKVRTEKTVACPYGVHYSTIGGQNLAKKVIFSLMRLEILV